MPDTLLDAGVVLNDLLPAWLISIVLVVLLAYMCHRTAYRGLNMWHEETQKANAIQAAAAISSRPMPCLPPIHTTHLPLDMDDGQQLSAWMPQSAVSTSSSEADLADAVGDKQPQSLLSGCSVAAYTPPSAEDVEAGRAQQVSGGDDANEMQNGQQQQQQQPFGSPLWHSAASRQSCSSSTAAADAHVHEHLHGPSTAELVNIAQADSAAALTASNHWWQQHPHHLAAAADGVDGVLAGEHAVHDAADNTVLMQGPGALQASTLSGAAAAGSVMQTAQGSSTQTAASISSVDLPEYDASSQAMRVHCQQNMHSPVDPATVDGRQCIHHTAHLQLTSTQDLEHGNEEANNAMSTRRQPQQSKREQQLKYYHYYDSPRYVFPWLKLLTLAACWAAFLGFAALDSMLPLCSWHYLLYMLGFLAITVVVTALFIQGIVLLPAQAVSVTGGIAANGGSADADGFTLDDRQPLLRPNSSFEDIGELTCSSIRVILLLMLLCHCHVETVHMA